MRTLVALVTCMAFLGCNSNLKVYTSSIEGKDAVEGEVIMQAGPTENIPPPAPEFVGEFAFARSYIQSRSSILLQLDNKILNQGEKFSLENLTTKIKLLDNEQANFAITSGRFMSLAGGYSLYEFAPAEYAGKVAYGANEFRLNIAEESAPRYATASLVLKDFPIFEMAVTQFYDDVQKKNNFQGWVNTVGQPTVNAQGTTLTVGMPNIVNR